MKIEIGKTYATAEGGRVTITGHNSSPEYPFEGDMVDIDGDILVDQAWTEEGRWCRFEPNAWDLVAELREHDECCATPLN